MELIACHAKTHHGPYLSLNEDNYKFDFDNHLYMVLDAFGGSGYGDLGLQWVESNVGRFFDKIVDDPEATQPFYYNPQFSLEANALLNSITYTHQLLLSKNANKPLDERVGVSGVFMVKDEAQVNLVNIGNTKSYLIRQNKLTLLTDENSINSLSKDDLTRIPQFALGLFEKLHYQIKSFQLEQNDRVLLMSDGVHAHIDELEAIKELNSGLDGREIIENLFQLANNNGNQDNQTLMILEF